MGGSLEDAIKQSSGIILIFPLEQNFYFQQKLTFLRKFSEVSNSATTAIRQFYNSIINYKFSNSATIGISIIVFLWIFIKYFNYFRAQDALVPNLEIRKTNLSF